MCGRLQKQYPCPGAATLRLRLLGAAIYLGGDRVKLGARGLEHATHRLNSPGLAAPTPGGGRSARNATPGPDPIGSGSLARLQM